MELSRWHVLEYAEFISSPRCSHAALTEFARKTLLQQLHLTVLCHGNATPAEALQLVEGAAKALGSEALPRSQRPAPRLLQLPAGVEVHLRLHESLCSDSERALHNADELNSAVELMLQAGIDERPRSMLVELLAQVGRTGGEWGHSGVA